ncbi:MAG: hypothetical protein M9928_15575 [Anaerolineae bacterium]|nr:hypothetical protein [Anaerolineae bacterium]MCO5194567.1 hypothetical protein [Anaerolineae bacterium]MCO5199641.1 hypothetical protein [Anaerolineae bacterium]MCO5206456.1 hypothetical protein [Anaerolineae bacterium]
MNEITTAAQLLSPVALGIVVAAIIQIFKPSMHKRFPADEAGERDQNYRIYMNLIAFLLALVLSFSATLVTTWPPTPDSLFTAFLLAVFGTLAAIGSAEITGNFTQRLTGN